MAKIGIVEVGDIISYQLPAETNFLPVVDYRPARFFRLHHNPLTMQDRKRI